MIDKNEFVSNFNSEDAYLVSNLYEKYKFSFYRGEFECSSEFYPPQIWNKLKKLENKLQVKVYLFGVFKESERRVVAFSSEDYRGSADFPVKVIKIKNKSHFSNLKHKDYLGAIMSLGLKREKYGDLIVKNDECYVPIFKDDYNYILGNLTSVGNSPCIITESDIIEAQSIMPDFKAVKLNVSSMRLDVIVSGITNVSRSKSNDFIKAGLVLVDYLRVSRKDFDVQEGSTITVRGFGKYRICEITGNTSKGRLKLIVRKYI